jgi:hypothetical protein
VLLGHRRHRAHNKVWGIGDSASDLGKVRREKACFTSSTLSGTSAVDTTFCRSHIVPVMAKGFVEGKITIVISITRWRRRRRRRRRRRGRRRKRRRRLVAQWHVLDVNDGVSAKERVWITLDKALFSRIGTIHVTCAVGSNRNTWREVVYGIIVEKTRNQYYSSF